LSLGAEPNDWALFWLAILCIVVRLTLADSNSVLLAYFESLRLGMMCPVLTGVENVLTGVDNGMSTITIQTSVGFARRAWNRMWNLIIPYTPERYIRSIFYTISS
jgi:hypothetical protein